MKNKIIKKRLLTETAMMVLLALVLSAVMYFLVEWHDEQERENRQMQTQLTALQNEMQSLDGKYTNWRQNNALYAEAETKRKKGLLKTSRDFIQRRFAKYNDRFLLRDTKIEILPVKEVEDAQYKRQTASMTYSEVTVKFNAFSDLDAYRLIETMEQEFTGVIKMINMEVTKNNPISAGMLEDIANTGSADVVSVSLKFLWLGISQVENETEEKQNAQTP